MTDSQHISTGSRFAAVAVLAIGTIFLPPPGSLCVALALLLFKEWSAVPIPSLVAQPASVR